MINEEYKKISHLTDKVNSFWSLNNVKNKNHINRNESPENFINGISVNFDFTIDGIAFKEQGKIQEAIDWLCENYPDVTYSKISEHINKGVIRNNLSVNHCQTNIMRHRLNNYHDLSKCNSVLEIGAGYGAFAREILLCNDKMKYVIIDIPESLICSYTYLGLEFPEKKQIIVNDVDDINEDFDILYIPIGAIEKFVNSKIINNFDLFVNTCSMGEMDNNIIEKYYNLTTNILNIKSAYWLNRFMNVVAEPYRKARKDENGCMAKVPKKWNIKHWEYMPTFLKCPEIIKYHAKMVEMYATIEKFDDKTESNITNEDSIFQIWNIHRLNPTLDSRNLLIDSIRKFEPNAEELWYYEGFNYLNIK